MERAMAPHSSTLAWRIPWVEEPGRLQYKGSLRVTQDWATERLHFLLSCIGEGNGNPLQGSCLENPRDGGAWWAAVYGVAQSWTRLKRLSSSSSNQSLNEWETRFWERSLTWLLRPPGCLAGMLQHRALIGSGHRQLLCKTHIPSSGNVETKDSVCELLLYLSILKYFFAWLGCAGS